MVILLTLNSADAGLPGNSRDVEARSGHGSPAEYEVSESDASRPERSFFTLGKSERSRETQTRQQPQNY